MAMASYNDSVLKAFIHFFKLYILLLLQIGSVFFFIYIVAFYCDKWPYNLKVVNSPCCVMSKEMKVDYITHHFIIIECSGLNYLWNVFEIWCNRTAEYQIKLSNKHIYLKYIMTILLSMYTFALFCKCYILLYISWPNITLKYFRKRWFFRLVSTLMKGISSIVLISHPFSPNRHTQILVRSV